MRQLAACGPKSSAVKGTAPPTDMKEGGREGGREGGKKEVSMLMATRKTSGRHEASLPPFLSPSFLTSGIVEATGRRQWVVPRERLGLAYLWLEEGAGAEVSAGDLEGGRKGGREGRREAGRL